MQARKSDAQTENQIDQITDEAKELTWLEITEQLKDVGFIVSIKELKTFFASKVNNVAYTWKSIPVQHQYLIEEFKIQKETENNTPKLSAESTNQVDIPVIENEPATTKRESKKSSALTKGTKTAIDKSSKNVGKIKATEDAVLIELSRQRGAVKGSIRSSVEDAAEEIQYVQNRKKRTAQRIASHIEDIEKFADFDPVAYAKSQMGVDTQDVSDDIDDLVGSTLGKLQDATQEIGDNSYSNGKVVNMSRLDQLMNSID